MKHYRIEIECDEFYLADTLYSIGAMIENDSILDQMENGKVETECDALHYKATIHDIKD